MKIRSSRLRCNGKITPNVLLKGKKIKTNCHIVGEIRNFFAETSAETENILKK